MSHGQEVDARRVLGNLDALQNIAQRHPRLKVARTYEILVRRERRLVVLRVKATDVQRLAQAVVRVGRAAAAGRAASQTNDERDVLRAGQRVLQNTVSIPKDRHRAGQLTGNST